MSLWSIEKSLVRQGYGLICGVDEAGRGPLAGPVCAACVILPFGTQIPGLDDSKKLSEKKRSLLFDIITDQALAYGIAFASNEEVDSLNILNATYLAMNRAFEKLDIKPEFTIVDGNRKEGLGFLCDCIVGGDGKSASIAAASILAKVSRDRLMVELATEFPQYGFDKHKGYGTKMHIESLREHGMSRIHRQTFLSRIL